MRQVDVVILPQCVNEAYFKNKIVVVVDILRASTCIVTAFANGAKALIPLQEPEDVRRMAAQLSVEQPLLCGEREGVALPGFDLANSPFEYTGGRVKDKLLLYTSSNGSQMMVKAKRASRILIGAFVNLKSVVQSIETGGESICIACSGREGQFSLEDTVCAGMLVHGLGESDTLSDSAHAAHVLYQYHADDIKGMLEQSIHGQYLTSLGLADDLAFASQVDRFHVVPTWLGDRFAVE